MNIMLQLWDGSDFVCLSLFHDQPSIVYMIFALLSVDLFVLTVVDFI